VACNSAVCGNLLVWFRLLRGCRAPRVGTTRKGATIVASEAIGGSSHGGDAFYEAAKGSASAFEAESDNGPASIGEATSGFLRLQPKTAFSPLPPVHRADL
jgi:hypothetical protein